MKIHILGSLSGTEPFKNRHHTAWVLELDNGHLYWFDAGENCSHTGYIKQLDFFNIKSIFISHPHYDHMGGLLNLFAVYSKMHYIEQDTETYRKFKLFLPVPELWEPFEKLTRALDAWPPATGVEPELLSDGGVFENEEIKVEFRGNRHIPIAENEPFRSFSFRITSEGKTVVYSGDIDSVDEIADWNQNCHALLIESGHHHPWDVCRKLHDDKCNIGKLIFMHHGRDVLYMPTESRIRSERVWDGEILFADDGMSVDL